MTKIVGILNVTPDSFSDGGKFLDLRSAVSHLEKLIAEGADIIDIGGQSTRPESKKISTEEEWSRIEPLLQEIKNNNYKIKVSVDSINPETTRNALEYDIAYINDVSGFVSDEMKKLAQTSGKKIIFMHSLSIPADKDITFPEGADVVLQLENWLEKKIRELEKLGIKKENMIFDPGIGFGKTPKQCMDIIINANKFQQKGIEVLIGHSEKSFLGLFTEQPPGRRLIETCVLSYILASKNIDYIRVHNVESNKRAIRIAQYK